MSESPQDLITRHYVTHGVGTGALDGHYSRLLCQAAPSVHCPGFVEGAGLLDTSGRVQQSYVYLTATSLRL